jgi:glycosyltransferase involved in cell wall biosynthesis
MSYIKNSYQKKILHITRFYGPQFYGGIQQTISELIKNSNHSHTVACFCSQTKKIKKKLINNVEIITFPATFKLCSDYFSFSFFKYLVKNLKKYDIYHIHFPFFFPFLYFFFIRDRFKLIVTYHANLKGMGYLASIVFFSLFKNFLKKNVKFFHISSKKFLKKTFISDKKNVLVENFSFRKHIIKSKNIRKKILDLCQFNKYLIFIGRNTHYKNFSFLKKLINQNKDINFLIISKKINFKFNNMNFISNPNNDEKFYFIKNARGMLLVSDSQSESYGIVLIEALMYGVPSVVFEIGTGTTEIIKNNKTGFVEREINNLNGFSDKIKKIYTNDDIHKKLSINCQKTYEEKFSNYGFLKLDNVYAKL